MRRATGQAPLTGRYETAPSSFLQGQQMNAALQVESAHCVLHNLPVIVWSPEWRTGGAAKRGSLSGRTEMAPVGNPPTHRQGPSPTSPRNCRHRAYPSCAAF